MQMETKRYSQGQKRQHPDQSAKRGKNQPAGPPQWRRRAEDQLKAGEPGPGFPLSYADTQRLLREMQVLTEANSELKVFNATISHDLCTPITAINGYCQVLTGICRSQLDDQAMQYLGSIYDATLHMKQLIASLLSFSRISEIPLNREKIDLSGLAEEVAAQLKFSAPDRRATFRIARGISAVGDAGLCRSVLDNIMGNAWKHSFGREHTVIELGMKQLAGNRVFFVRDNGPGFDPALADQLFAPFQRLPGTAAEGHGIGLATVDRIVRRHGGRVWAESTQGEGATFFFTME